MNTEEIKELLQKAFITPEKEGTDRSKWVGSCLRRTFCLSGNIKDITEAEVYITACGIYEIYINGTSPQTGWFAPGFTNYDHRLQYQTYDILSLLRQGENVLSVLLGNGWYRGWNGGTGGIEKDGPVWGTDLKLSAVICVRYRDGSKEIIDTKDQVKATQDGPLRQNDMRGGETYDATMELPGWKEPGYDDHLWHDVFPSSYRGTLIPQEGLPIHGHEEFHGTLLRTPAGEDVIDFGQNISGVVRLRINGKKGAKIRILHGETLDENGNFTLKNLSDAEEPFGQVITYIAKDGFQEYTPHFTYMGFRYIKLEDYPLPLDAKDFTAVALYSDVSMVGSFSCSNEKINRLFENACWGLKGNFMDIPTDCPTREHAGWTGDAMVFCEASNWLADCRVFWKKWLRDLALQQDEDGCVPCIAPDSNPKYGERINGSAGWGDAIEIIPFSCYTFYRDKSFIEEFYPAVCRWLSFNVERAKKNNTKNKLKRGAHRKYILDTGFHWGEWKEPGVELGGIVETYMKCSLSPDAEVATGFFAHAADIASRMASILGKEEESRSWRQLFENIRNAYQKEFLPKGLPVEPERQCKYVRPIAFDLVASDQKKFLAKKLSELVEKNHYHIGTGFLSTGWILPALSENGQLETAYRLLENEEEPGWLCCVNRHATTMWENWNGIDASGKPRDSLNHYSSGSVVSWFFRGICGIHPPVGSHVELSPHPGGSLSWAKASWETDGGVISSAWYREGKQIRYEFLIPSEMTATLLLNGSREELSSGSHTRVVSYPE